MKTAAIFLIIICNIFGMEQKASIKSAHAAPCISLAEAEKVLGEPAVLLNNTTSEKDGIRESNCGYAAKTADPEKHVTGSVYVTVKQYPSAAAAQKAYTDIVVANRMMAGQEKVAIGDEGYYHTDGEHFHLFIFRKDREMAAMKINKITSKTSLPELRKLAEAMAGKRATL
ncbi:hypothetical protein HQ865_21980 [Mucilaginibacter mali]|uniref:Uncharacterized protein n=1 Tax=Mucilaginibacter mali TaxID=2740462 RepID=A0A7D4TRU7_9SPHI|nr:hypothetical protein [Mucilaginibacter mali]QKJ32314.1 hypothetical protein HQ865_21980 [Mucilaginibacter mali]